MDIDEATDIIVRAALQRLIPEDRLDPMKIREQITEVLREQGETIFAQLSNEARDQLRRDGRMIDQQLVRLSRIDELIDYGRSLIAKYKAQTLDELPYEEQAKFARLWESATSGAKVNDN